ncbi:MAG TPA: hypothetical protein PKY82_00705 [Pyrinomonadaceae bacterium]|nr:hypothetical protein [Pyrinomonadaceae bacterium]
MKMKLLMIVILVCFGQVAVIWGQTKPKSFYVKYITLETDPNPRFVWDYANKIISFGRESNNKEAACLKKELMKTGLFSKIEYKFAKLKDSDDYEFHLTINYKSPNPVYKVSKIELSSFKEVNNSNFKIFLASENLIGKSLSLKTGYVDFEDKIIESVKKSIIDETKREEFKLPWLIFKLNKKNELEVIVAPDFNGCKNLTK